MNENTIELFLDGNKEEFEVLLRFRFKGNDYIALSPISEDEDSAAVMQIKKTEDDEEIFCTIEEENAAKEVFVHFISLWELMDDEE